MVYRHHYLPAFKGLLCIDITGTTDDRDVRNCVVHVTARVVHVIAVLVGSLADDVVDHVVFSVGVCVAVVGFVKCRTVELVVVDDADECVVGAVVIASVAVVVSFRLQRGSLKKSRITGVNDISMTYSVHEL